MKKTTSIYDKVYRQEYVWVHVKSADEFNAYLRTIIQNFDEVVDTSGDSEIEENDGETLDLIVEGKNVIYFWFDTKDATAIVHELAHAVFKCMRSRGVVLSEESEESFCYVLSFLYNEVLMELAKKKKVLDKQK